MNFYRVNEQRGFFRYGLIFLILCMFCSGFIAEAQAGSGDDAATNAGQDTSSQKTGEVSKSSSAITIITQDDIRRSGASSVPEVLRMVPGLEVARISANVWAISARGFNGQYSNKLMVTVDGRSAYSSLYGGVFWDVQDMMLEDIERIEVNRGPDATLQGSNAVNGSINIITKHSRETVGSLVSTTVGTREREASYRYGARIGQNTTYRLYVKDFRRNGGMDADGDDTPDSWQQARAGFRVDRDTSTSLFNIQGETYSGREGRTLRIVSLDNSGQQELDDKGRVSGGNLNAHWSYAFSKNSVIKSQCTFEQSEISNYLLDESRTTAYLDISHHFNLGPISNLSWGFGYRRTTDEITSSFIQSFDPEKRTDALGHFYFLDDISFFKDRVRFSLGDRLEHNGYTGWENQPSARVQIMPSPISSIWGSVSKAVSTPSRADFDLRQATQVYRFPDSDVPFVYTTEGSEEALCEEVTSYELGLRVLPTPWFNLDVAAFYNDYDKLRSVSTADAYLVNDPDQPYRVIPIVEGSDISGTSRGYEACLNYTFKDWLRIDFMYTYTKLRVHQLDDDVQATDDTLPGASPHKQYGVKASMDVGRNIDVDVYARHVDELPDLDVPAYTGLDVRLGYRPVPGLEIALIGKNLLDTHHAEFNPQEGELVPTEVVRSVAGKVTWKF